MLRHPVRSESLEVVGNLARPRVALRDFSQVAPDLFGTQFSRDHVGDDNSFDACLDVEVGRPR